MSQPAKFKAFLEFTAYSNLFYGICVLATIIETEVRLQLGLSHWSFYGLAFSSTVLFYNYPYLNTQWKVEDNARSMWLSKYKKLAWLNVYILTVVFILSSITLISRNLEYLQEWSYSKWILILIFPLIAWWYYGMDRLFSRIRLRDIGWLKPLVIGLVWAGVTVVYPIIFSEVRNVDTQNITFLNMMLFIKCTMYLTLLAVLFDIKDVIEDKSLNLQTLIIRFGVKKTISYIIIPATLLGLTIFLSYAYYIEMSLYQILLLSIPYLALILITRSFNIHRSLLFYLIIIDGLIFIKALIGIISFV